MQPKARRQIGAHYTSERDILKVVRSLFLDDLRAEFDAAQKRQLHRARETPGRISRENLPPEIFRPACGCGNFLVITYRELRQLELETLKELFGQQKELTLMKSTGFRRWTWTSFTALKLANGRRALPRSRSG